MPAGLTGWAQVHDLRGDTSVEERARFDNFYIENWSLWLHIAILFRSLKAFAPKSRPRTGSRALKGVAPLAGGAHHSVRDGTNGGSHRATVDLERLHDARSAGVVRSPVDGEQQGNAVTG